MYIRNFLIASTLSMSPFVGYAKETVDEAPLISVRIKAKPTPASQSFIAQKPEISEEEYTNIWFNHLMHPTSKLVNTSGYHFKKTDKKVKDFSFELLPYYEFELDERGVLKKDNLNFTLFRIKFF